jgi:uncharacterized protein YbjT (DUF2867 family)
MILIVGGTGRLGRATAHQLLERGEQVRILARTPDKADDLRRLGAEIVLGDLTQPSSLDAACAGADTVFDAAHSLRGRGKASFSRVDGTGKLRLIEAAKNAGVKRYIFTSVHGASPHHPVPFCRTKYTVEESLRASGMSFTILRPTFMYIPHAVLIGGPLLKRGKTVILGRGTNPRNFLSVTDAAQFVVRAMFDPQARNQVIEIGGPDNLSNNQVAELYARVAGIKPKITHVPPGALWIMATLVKPFRPEVSNIFRWALYSDTANETFDPTALARRYSVSLTRLEDWIRAQTQIVPTGVLTSAV